MTRSALMGAFEWEEMLLLNSIIARGVGGSGTRGVSGVTNNMNFIACMSAAAYH